MRVAEHDDGGETAGGRPPSPRVFRLFAAAALVAGIGIAGLAANDADAQSVTPAVAATAYVLSDVHCTPSGNGVLDLTLINDSDQLDARFTVHDQGATASTAVLVAPSSAHALSFANLADGDLELPVQVNGAAQVVRATVDCDLPRLTAAVSSDVATGTAPMTAELPRTGTDLGGLLIGGLLVSAGIAASLVARRRYF